MKLACEIIIGIGVFAIGAVILGVFYHYIVERGIKNKDRVALVYWSCSLLFLVTLSLYLLLY